MEVWDPIGSSSCSIMASHDANTSIYDIFLSFRGEDIVILLRIIFTIHQTDQELYFRDNEEINRGGEQEENRSRKSREQS